MGRYTLRRPAAGFVYCLINPAWPGWVKVGSTTDPGHRLRQYQTGTPHRDFSMAFTIEFADRLAAERELKRVLGGLRTGRSEWVRVHPQDILHLLQGIERRS